MRPDGTQFENFATGIRNSVGFDWQPSTKELWFTDNGRDLLGDDAPPDELNHAPKAGMNFGYPYCHGGSIADPQFGSKHSCNEFTPPAQKLWPHVASLGMHFYTGKQFPSQYQNQIFIAEHGSWNRSKKIGYRITMVTLNGSNAASYTPFATGWLTNEEQWGRPVDLLVLPDGSLLVSDDYAGAIYRIFYQA
jgi:glucose/arabinose dehydrogenase